MKKVVVISLGGSVIMPEKINFELLDGFVKILRKNFENFKFVIVCGGGSIARKYIDALRLEGKSERELSEAGIMATRMNARFMMEFFGKDANKSLPMDMKDVVNDLRKHNVVICGALRFSPHSTSDATAAKLANFLKSDFINITNVKGLYSNDPSKDPKAKLIPYQSWKEFESRALKIKFQNGQHFVLDQNAAVLIKKNKIRTYIVGPSLKNLSNLFHGKTKFVGTLVYG